MLWEIIVLHSSTVRCITNKTAHFLCSRYCFMSDASDIDIPSMDALFLNISFYVSIYVYISFRHTFVNLLVQNTVSVAFA